MELESQFLLPACTSALSCTCTSSDGGFSLLPGSGSVWVKIPGGGSRTIVSASGGPGTISAPALRPVQVVPPVLRPRKA